MRDPLFLARPAGARPEGSLATTGGPTAGHSGEPGTGGRAAVSLSLWACHRPP